MESGELRNLGRALKGVREQCGLTGKDVAERAGISASYISEIETGKRPLTESFASRVASALGLEPADFLFMLRNKVAEESPPRLVGFLTDAPIVREAPPIYKTPTLPPDNDANFRALAEWFVSQVSRDEAWKIVADFTNSAKAGDHSAALRLKALIDILMSTAP